MNIQIVTSPSGITAWLVQSPLVPVFSMQFSFAGGMFLDPPDKAGNAYLTSIMLDEGAGEYSGDAFQEQLTNNAISLGFNAGRDDFNGSLYSLTENADKAFGLLGLALTDSHFKGDSLERMRAAAMSEVKRNQANPAWIASRNFNDTIFSGHPYGRPGQGDLDSLARITADDLRAFTTKIFTRACLKVAVAGDITPEALGALLDKAFAGLPAGDAAGCPVPTPAVRQAVGETRLVERPIPQRVIVFAQDGIGRKDPDWYAANLLNYVVGSGSFNARLMQTLRVEKGLTYGISTGFSTLKGSNLWSGQMTADGNRADEAITALKEIWADVAANGITETELGEAKAFLIGNLPLQLTSTERLAGALISLRQDELPIDYLDSRDASIEAVTLADINRVAKRLMNVDSLTVVQVGHLSATPSVPIQ